jgi:hypothetical protein
MKHVDALGRQPAVSLVETSVKERINAVQSSDKKLVAICELAKTGQRYAVNGVNLLVVPKSMR